MNGDKPVYNVQQRARAGTTATLRAVAAVYIFYLGWTVLRNTLQGGSTVPSWVGWVAGLVFMGGALAFAVYIYKRYRADLEAAIVTPKNETEEKE